MSDQSSPDGLQGRRASLLRVLRATLTLPAQITFYASALGAIALMPAEGLPAALGSFAGGIGVNALSSILERVARGELTDEQIRAEVQAAVADSQIDILVTADEFQRTVARLARWQDLLRYAIQDSEYEVVQRLLEQAQQHAAIMDELRGISDDLKQIATREQADEILIQLRRLDELPVAGAPFTRHQRHFDDLSPEDFERLIYWLVKRSGEFDEVQWYGGARDKGRDVVAFKHTAAGREKCYIQCKRYQSITFSTLRDELDKLAKHAQESPEFAPDTIVFATACPVPAQAKDQAGVHARGSSPTRTVLLGSLRTG